MDSASGRASTAVHGFFFNDTATTEIYPLPLHDALPIYREAERVEPAHARRGGEGEVVGDFLGAGRHDGVESGGWRGPLVVPASNGDCTSRTAAVIHDELNIGLTDRGGTGVNDRAKRAACERENGHCCESTSHRFHPPMT